MFMSYKNLTDEQKTELLTKLNWDYDVSAKDLRDLINGKKTSAGAFTTEALKPFCGKIW